MAVLTIRGRAEAMVAIDNAGQLAGILSYVDMLRCLTKAEVESSAAIAFVREPDVHTLH
jgi:CBS-domain-containing membrane protein